MLNLLQEGIAVINASRRVRGCNQPVWMLDVVHGVFQLQLPPLREEEREGEKEGGGSGESGRSGQAHVTCLQINATQPNSEGVSDFPPPPPYFPHFRAAPLPSSPPPPLNLRSPTVLAPMLAASTFGNDSPPPPAETSDPLLLNSSTFCTDLSNLPLGSS